jgi:hypothetical protein
VTLDGSQSYDPDNNIRDYFWKRIEADGTERLVARTAVATVEAPLGESVYRLQVVDAHQQLSRAEVLVRVVDTAPPAIVTAQVSPQCVWPPNHKWATFQLGQEIHVEAVDACDPHPRVMLADVQVTELGAVRAPDADEVLVNSERAVCLRAERLGESVAGRSYHLEVHATDAAGNAAGLNLPVAIGHDSSPSERCHRNIALHDAPESVCLTMGEP